MNEVNTLIIMTLLLLGSPGPAPIALAATGATAGVKNGLPFFADIMVLFSNYSLSAYTDMNHYLTAAMIIFLSAIPIG